MGAYPEPAPSADDVSRPVLIGSGKVNETEAYQSPAARRHTSLFALKRSLLAGLVAGLMVGAGPSGASALPAADLVANTQTRSDLRTDDVPSEWDGTRLMAEDGIARTVLEHHPGSPPEDKAGADTLRFGEVRVPRQLAETILRASEATGVDPVYMMALADKESSFDTDVKSSASSAQGLFQFVTATWLEMIRDYGARHGLAEEAAAVKGRGHAIAVSDGAMRKRVLGLRNDPFVSGLMAGELIKRDRARIENRLGRELKTTELYIAHFLGTANAGKFLSLSADDPERDARKAFGRAARANGSIFTLKDGGKRRSLTVAEVHERLDGMIDRRIEQYQAITAIVAQEAEMADDEHAPDRPVLDARLRLKNDVVPSMVAPTIQ